MSSHLLGPKSLSNGWKQQNSDRGESRGWIGKSPEQVGE